MAKCVTYVSEQVLPMSPVHTHPKGGGEYDEPLPYAVWLSKPCPTGDFVVTYINKELGQYDLTPCFNWWSHGESNPGPLECHL